MVLDHSSSDSAGLVPPSSGIDSFQSRVALHLNALAANLQSSPNPGMHSPAIFSGSAQRRIRLARPDVVNLHWVAGGYLTISQIGRIPFPVVWRLPDMWPYCGAEHLDGMISEARWRHGYERTNRPPGHSGIDIDRWTWCRKRRAWRKPYHIVAPSRWAADRVSSSYLMASWPVTVIPNAIGLSEFTPYGPWRGRATFGLPTSAPVVLFGAHGGAQDPNKGFDLLHQAMTRVQRAVPDVHLAVFGQDRPEREARKPYPVSWLGRITDDAHLAQLYSCADVMVVPSRQESFGQTGSESHACGTPVVAFRSTGLADVVSHRVTGYLAEHLDTADLATGIEWVLSLANKTALCAEARKRALRLWSPSVVAAQYLSVYERAIAEESVTDPRSRRHGRA